MAGKDGRHSELITQLLRHVTSSHHDADLKGDIFRRTIYPPRLVVIAFIFAELRSWKTNKKPGLNGVQLIVYFSHPKVTATRKLLPLRPANSEGNGGCNTRNFTVVVTLLTCTGNQCILQGQKLENKPLSPCHME